MAEIINLRLARKSKARVEKEALSAENRAKFGQPRSVKALEAAKAKLEGARFDGHKLSSQDK